MDWRIICFDQLRWWGHKHLARHLQGLLLLRVQQGQPSRQHRFGFASGHGWLRSVAPGGTTDIYCTTSRQRRFFFPQPACTGWSRAAQHDGRVPRSTQREAARASGLSERQHVVQARLAGSGAFGDQPRRSQGRAANGALHCSRQHAPPPACPGSGSHETADAAPERLVQPSSNQVAAKMHAATHS